MQSKKSCILIIGLQKNSGGATYLSIADGKIVRNHKEAKQGVTVSRTTKTGKTVHEEKFDSITGRIVGLKTHENDFGKQWHLTFTDGEDSYIVTMPYSSRYSTSFLKALPNIDLSKDVKLMPWSMTDKQDASKKVTGITMWQDGNKVAPAFTKDEPNGLPQMKQVKVKGQMTWDDSDMMEFLETVAMKQFMTTCATDDEEAPF